MLNFSRVSRLPLVCLAGMVLAACSSSPQVTESPQKAPGSVSRPILSDTEAQHFTPELYFAATPDSTTWRPQAIKLPASPDFLVGPAGTSGIQFDHIQGAIDAAISKHSAQRQYIAIMPGRYSGTVYIPKASNNITLYGTGDSPIDTVITYSLDGSVDEQIWSDAVNANGQYLPGDPAWYMFHSCLNRQPAGLLCSAVLWSQNDGLQLHNLTIENSLGNSVDGGDHPAVALRSDGDKLQLEAVNLLSRQNTFLVTNSDLNNHLLENNRQPRGFISNSYIEGDVAMVAGRGTLVFENSIFRIVTTRGTAQQYIFAPATLASVPYGFLVTNSQFIAPASARAKFGSNWDIHGTSASVNGQLVIRDSTISAGFDNTNPWGNAILSGNEFSGNVGIIKDKQLIRNLQDQQFNRLWEYHNYGPGSEISVVPVKSKQ